MIGFVYVRDIPKIIIQIVIGMALLFPIIGLFAHFFPHGCPDCRTGSSIAFMAILAGIFTFSSWAGNRIWERIDLWRYEDRKEEQVIAAEKRRQERRRRSRQKLVDEKYVRQKWPDAIPVRTVDGVEISTDSGKKKLGRGRTQDDAWRDAAERIPKV